VRSVLDRGRDEEEVEERDDGMDDRMDGIDDEISRTEKLRN